MRGLEAAVRRARHHRFRSRDHRHGPRFATTKDDYSLESYILGLNHYQIELLANLDQVPEAGGIVWVTFPKAENGSGFPARAIAMVP